MSKINSTPGPWAYVVHDHSMASLGVLPNPGMGDPLVCTFSPCQACADRADPKEWQWGRCQTPSEADARLIAAAPELLEASERLLAVFDQQRMTTAERIIVGVSDSALRTEGNAAIEALRAAIAKAHGEVA